MNVTLDPEVEAFVRQQVDGGVFASPEEVVAEALKVLRSKMVRTREIERLREEIRIGIEEADAGLTEPFDPIAIYNEVQAELAANPNRERPGCE